MLYVGNVMSRNCSGVARRELLQVGGVSALGLTLAGALRLGEKSASAAPATNRRDPACIFIFLEGGPSQFETFDPKPNAPDDVRGPYGPVATAVPGIRICELLPMLAQRMKHCALIRSLTGTTGSHTSVPILTGSIASKVAYGAVVAKLKGDRGDLPPYIHLGGKLFNSPGVGGGILGAAYDPVEVPDPSGKTVQLPNFALAADIPANRFQQRTALLGAIDKVRAAAASRSVDKMDMFYHRAVNILTSPKVRDAFDLSKEKASLRERYGANFFGQSALMARRLIENGARFVQIKWYDWDGAWDIHGFNSTGVERMEQELCPRFDQGLSALLDDLQQRGMLSSTLVVAVGEMGRTPKVNYWGGRDHWGPCLTALLAGAGVPGGTVVGSSDAKGAYPETNPVQPPELAATLYRLLGFNTNLDLRLRPFIGAAAPVAQLV